MLTQTEQTWTRLRYPNNDGFVKPGTRTTLTLCVVKLPNLQYSQSRWTVIDSPDPTRLCAVLEHADTDGVYEGQLGRFPHPLGTDRQTLSSLQCQIHCLSSGHFPNSPYRLCQRTPVNSKQPFDLGLYIYTYVRTRSTRHARQQTALWKSDSVVNKLCTSPSLKPSRFGSAVDVNQISGIESIVSGVCSSRAIRRPTDRGREYLAVCSCGGGCPKQSEISSPSIDRAACSKSSGLGPTHRHADWKAVA